MYIQIEPKIVVSHFEHPFSLKRALKFLRVMRMRKSLQKQQMTGK
jgi:hypothetical protein